MILRDQFGILPKRKTIGYSKPYPNDYDLIPLPPKYRLPEFSKFNGSEGSSSIEHVSRYLAQLGKISASDPLRVRFFAQSLTGPAFGWYTSLPPDSIRTWKQLEEQFYIQYHSETTEAGIADLAQVRQRRGETVSEYIQRFRNVKNRCYSARITEKEAVELAVSGLAAPIKDLVFQVEYNSLAHMAQKLTAYEQRHPELYQDKFKRPVGLVETDEFGDSAEDQEVAVAEWARGAAPVTCTWVKPQGPAKGFDFDGPYTAMAKTKKKAVTLVARTKRRPVQAIGPDVMTKGTSLRNKSGACGISDHSQTISLTNTSVSMTDVGSTTEMTKGIIGLTMTMEDIIGMSRLPTIDNCPECRQKKKDTGDVSVFKRLGTLPSQSRRAEPPQEEDLEELEDEEEDRYHRPRWCPDRLSHSQKRRVQWLRSLEEAEAQYLHTLRKARPDLAVKIQQTLDAEDQPPKKEWRPKQTKADAKASAGTNMVFVLPSEFCAPRNEEVPIAQFDFGPRPVIFEKPREKSYKHLKALYLKGYINGQPIGRMLVDTGAAVNIMPYSMLRRLGHSNSDLIKTNVTLSDSNGQASETQGLLERDIFDLFLPEFDKPWVIHLRETCCCSTNLCSWRPNTVYKNRSSRRHQLPSSYILPVFSIDLAGDGKLGYGFTSADELEEIDIGPGDKPRPTFISKKLDPCLRSLMIARLKEYPDCFAWDYTEMPGLDRSIIEHRLPLKKGFRPFQQRARQMKAEVLEEVKKEIEKMLAAGFIRPCRYAEWISSVVPVEKKDGRMRVAIDFRDLNRATPKDEYPMPVAETLINAAAGHKVLSFMDGNAGYNQIFMAPEDINKTAFRVPGAVGLFEYVVMTFGLKNAGATYQ
ncbi:hypothetical protein QYE76_035286 [Lolium multiflorum]|uniref:Retrotransposon protein, putative, unclassified n=1 Tax=Lolium multiflorum TaxID=4521 RepID=A0AAD8VP23_LOLMU|nr:hypothetical protein QYE76_035286 [Lolium multiflorum]